MTIKSQKYGSSSKNKSPTAVIDEDDLYDLEDGDEDGAEFGLDIDEAEEEMASVLNMQFDEEGNPVETSEEAEKVEGNDEGDDSDVLPDSEPKSRRKPGAAASKRIATLTKRYRTTERELQKEREEKEALRIQLKRLEANESRAEQEAIKSRAVELAQKLNAARAADDANEEIEVLREIAQSAQRSQIHEARATLAEAEAEAMEKRRQEKPAAPQLVQEGIDYVQSNPWLFNPITEDQRYAAGLARQISEELENKGYDPHHDPEFFELLDLRLARTLQKQGVNVVGYNSEHSQQRGSTAAPSRSENRASPTSQQAAGRGSSAYGQQPPARRGGVASSSSVSSGGKGPAFKLDPVQKAIAKEMGMTEVDYAAMFAARED